MADKSLTPIDLPELSSAPASPASGFHRFYAKTDGKAYSKSSGGTEYDLTTGVSLTTTGTSGAATLVGTTLNIPVYQSALTNPVTGTGTSGQVAYWNGTTTQTGSSNLTWNNTNKTLVINQIQNENGTLNGFEVTDSSNIQANFICKGGTASNAARIIVSSTASSSALIQNNDGTINNYFSVRFLGSNIDFETTTSNFVSRVTIMRANPTGVNVGHTAATSARLHVRGSGTTSATTALLVQNSTPTANFTIRDDGGYAFRNGTVGLAQTGYTTFTNLTTDRTCDANATTVEELADILGTLIEDLKTKGIISA